MAVLAKDPEVLPGGATLPTSLFRDPEVIKKEASRLSERGPPKDESTLNNFKLLHFEHMRQWIHNQELKGNTIKFSTFDSKYCIGF